MKYLSLCRKLHRRVVAIIAAPLLITILSGSLYATLQPLGIDAFWLVKLHTGNLGIVNLQPVYSPLLGLLTLLALATGAPLLVQPGPPRSGHRRSG